jgi:hypothetical protein
MADQQAGGETIRQMLQGFNTMQQQLGLLPMQSSQTPMGVGFQPPPPPPQIPHPSQAAIAAVAQQRDMMQQTIQAAQMTRYIPPPSTPIGGGGGGFAPMNPYMAGAIGGDMGGMANPMTMTAPSFGMYRPGGAFAALHVGQGPIPPIFNPFVPAVQPSHFMSPAMHQYQIMQGVQSRNSGIAAGLIDGAARFGGTALGFMSGGLIGGVLGHAAGGFLSDMMLGPGRVDAARGRQIQNMTAPWMVSGSMLNPYTGQGMAQDSGRATAMGLRKLATRDYDFQKTGYNTEDIMRITQMSSDQGLLAAARSPDDIVRRVKEISKAVKMLTQITGDPDIRNTLAALGQMKDLGFVGTGGQAGAIANRAMFARMAGVSQAGMNDLYGMPGAMMAQQSGLVGATGYMAGMTGGAAANIARSAGALNEMQLSRAGGVQGLGQINTMAQLSSLNQDVYMAAALKRGSKGIDIDIDAYRKAQTMTIAEVSNMAANNLREIGKEGIFELRTRKQEFKDKLAQQMSPFEMQMNVARQAKGLQRNVPGMNFGSALFATLQSGGMGDEQAESAARSLELQFTSREAWDGQIQQLRVQRRQLMAQEKAKRDQYRTPGLLTRMGRGLDSAMDSVSDFVSSPFRSLSRRMDRASEDEAAGDRGERIMRFNSVDLIRTRQDREMALRAMDNPVLRGRAAGAGDLDDGTFSRMGNRIGGLFGLSSTSDANRINEIASRTYGTAFGWHPFGSFGNAQSALRRVEDVAAAGRSVDMGQRLTGDKFTDAYATLQQDAPGVSMTRVIRDATQRLQGRAPTSGLIKSAGATSKAQYRASFIESMVEQGKTKEEAGRIFDKDPEKIMGLMSKTVMQYGENNVKETLSKAVDTNTALGGITGAGTRKQIDQAIEKLGDQAGLGDFSNAELARMKDVLSNNDPEVVKMMALRSARHEGTKANRQRAERALQAMEDKDPKKFVKLMEAADKLEPTLDAKTKKMFRGVVQHGSEDMDANLANLKDMFGLRMAKSADDFARQKISDVTGRKDVVNMDIMEAVKTLTDEQLSDARLGSKDTRELLKKARAGDVQALNKARVAMGPTAEKEILGGGEGGAMRALDERIAEMEQMRDELSNEGGDKATQLFAEGSTMLASAAKDLKEATENMKIAQNTPWYQSWFGGGGHQ